jgi:hypothetical protein
LERTTRPVSPISASDMARSTAAEAIPTSTRRLVTNSAVAGFAYNFVNPATNYQNGVDFHLDMAAAQFLSKQVFVGAVGYVYDQVSADRGSAPILGPIESRVFGVGPQVGYLFPVGNMQGALNLKAYFEFDSHDRPSGWNTWLTFAISPPAPPAAAPPPSRSPMIYK